MAVCCCSLAGTAACQHCRNNPMATDVWTSKTVTVDHIEAKPFGNGLDVCPVCGKPSTIGKPQTNADRIRAMTDEELAEVFTDVGVRTLRLHRIPVAEPVIEQAKEDWIFWLKQEADNGRDT